MEENVKKLVNEIIKKIIVLFDKLFINNYFNY